MGLMITWFLLLYSVIITGWVSQKVLRLTRRYRYDGDVEKVFSEAKLPTVSVCITARNETHALAENLEYVLASDYDKLEVLVLDDNSDDDTSLIIKSFAHAGVRFIPGRPLPAGWLGRNHAYYTLSREASGDLVFFLDVDTKLAPQAILQLVTYLTAHKLTMLSVQPRREDSFHLSALFGSLRQVWELLMANERTPPTTSGLWMIRRDTLRHYDASLAEYGMSLRPELHIAHHLQASKAYRYIIATKELGVRFEKKWHSQAETAERLYMPLFGKKGWAVVRTLALFAGLLAPYYCLLDGLFTQRWLQAGLAFAVSLLAGYMNAQIARLTYEIKGAVVRAILWPILLVQDVCFYVRSLVRYQTKTVMWKGRNILAQPSNRSHYEIDQ